MARVSTQPPTEPSRPQSSANSAPGDPADPAEADPSVADPPAADPPAADPPAADPPAADPPAADPPAADPPAADPPSEPWRPPDGPSPLRTGPVLEGRSAGAHLKTAELIDAFKGLTLIELKDFVKAFEEVFDVTAAAPIAIASSAPKPSAAREDFEGKTSFDVVLESAGERKIAVIKEVRALTSLGLKEAKDLVDAAPKVIFVGLVQEDAERVRALLEDAGATVSLG